MPKVTFQWKTMDSYKLLSNVENLCAFYILPVFIYLDTYSPQRKKKIVQNAPEAKSCSCALKLNCQNKQEAWEDFLPLPDRAVQVVIASISPERSWLVI